MLMEQPLPGTLTAACVHLPIYTLHPALSVTLQLLCPWNSPGKNTGVHSRFLLQVIFLTMNLI